MENNNKTPIYTIAYDKGYRVGKFIDLLIANVKDCGIEIVNKDPKEYISSMYNKHILSVEIFEEIYGLNFKIRLRNYDNNNN